MGNSRSRKIQIIFKKKLIKNNVNNFFYFFQLFDTVKEKRGLTDILSHCAVISGDCTLPDLGISVQDRKILSDNISIIYHCAATIRFDEALKTAVLLNTRGTKLMLELAENCSKLEVRY